MNRIIRAWCLFLAGLVISGSGSSCFIQEVCYGPKDCDPPNVCRQGKCVLGCEDDDDCELDYTCVDHECRYAVECATCAFPNADSQCHHGDCTMVSCHEGFLDINGDASDGCEYECTVSNGGVEICDGKDNDCDGLIDEDYDIDSDRNHCGKCGNICPSRPHAVPGCAGGKCIYVCETGWFDNNKQAEDGCEEEQCIPSEEICDGSDNDCDCPGDTNKDGLICGPGDEGVDEGFDKTLPETCGPYCITCEFPNADAMCTDGNCAMGECRQGWHNIDGIKTNGCEYPCEKTNGGIETCDQKDNDCDGKTDEDNVCASKCPPEMVQVGPSLCIDKYEASRKDATIDSHGSDNSEAWSRENVMPWYENPMTPEKFEVFKKACEAVGKHICAKNEYLSACKGPDNFVYVFGNDFDQEICNCVDTFCDDYCAAQGIEPCVTSSNCGYTYNCYEARPTGEFKDCTNTYGAFDLCGNLWETVESAEDPYGRGYEIKGGAFNCASPNARLACDYNAGWKELYAGFRCCLIPAE